MIELRYETPTTNFSFLWFFSPGVDFNRMWKGCLPTSGMISTSFSKISNSISPRGTLGEALVGTTETLTFTGCGTAVYAGLDGTAGSVTLGHCF